MHVGVGSGNPIKQQAVSSILGAGSDAFGTNATVETVVVDSGVAEQPTGHAETKQGAITRARAADRAGDFDLAVGLEGGVTRFEAADPLFLIMWAAVTDGDRLGCAMGPALPLPATVERRVVAGEELGPVIDDCCGTHGIAKAQGAAGVFSGGRIDREAALSQAVAGALGPFVCALYEADTQFSETD